MQTEREGAPHTPHRNRHIAQRLEGMLGVVMVIAIAILAIGLVYGIMSTGTTTPAYLR